ncbi:MAG: hypothetical protein HYX36_08215 [Rhizobiales bacterium]|nr:hypothetical protein [Hyphomicrobiales bacterium]
MIGVAVHLVNHGVTARLRQLKLLDLMLHIWSLAFLLKRALDQIVVVGRPKDGDRQPGEQVNRPGIAGGSNS